MDAKRMDRHTASYIFRHVCCGLHPGDVHSTVSNNGKIFSIVRFIIQTIREPNRITSCLDCKRLLLPGQCGQNQPVLTSQAGLETLKLLVDKCPNVLTQINCHTSFNRKCSPDTVAFLAEKYISRGQIGNLSIGHHVLFNAENSSVIQQIMAHVTSLQINDKYQDWPAPENVQAENRRQFVDQVSQSPSITSLGWNLQASWLEIFATIVKRNTNIRHLDLQNDRGLLIVPKAAFAICLAITESKILESVNLREVSIDKKLRLPNLDPVQKGNLRELRIADSDISNVLLVDILSRLPLLQKLSFGGCNIRIKPVLYALKHTNINCLVGGLSIMELNCVDGCEALKTNTSLKTMDLVYKYRQCQETMTPLLKVLMESNFTLVEIMSYFTKPFDRMDRRDIQCILELNGKDRSSLRDPATAKVAHLVDLLSHANIHSGSCNPQYALLRLLPGMWAQYIP